MFCKNRPHGGARGGPCVEGMCVANCKEKSCGVHDLQISLEKGAIQQTLEGNRSLSGGNMGNGTDACC